MRALVLEKFHRMQVVDLPDPRPGPGEVLLRIAATGICGSDLHGYTGENGRRSPGQVMGHESAGTIAALGEGVDGARFPLGAPATFNPVVVPAAQQEEYAGREQHCPDKTVIGVAADVRAAFADLLAVPARNVHLLDGSLPLALGALVEPLAVSVHAVRRGLRLGEAPRRVLVLGGGPIGQSIVLALRMEGVEQIVLSEPDPGRRALCAGLGAQVLDPAEGAVAQQAEAALGGPADLALDAVGITPTLADALAATRPGGTVVLVGMGAQRLDVAAFEVSTQERTVTGSFTYSAQEFADAAAWIGDHADLAATLVSRTVPLAQAPETFAALAHGDGTPGKVLVSFTEEEGR